MAKYRAKRPPNRYIPIDRMGDIFQYDQHTGLITSKADRTNSPKGTVIGYKNPHGYLCVAFEGKMYYAHRVAWALHKNEQPIEIDHINGNKEDNRICNLSSVTKSQHQQAHAERRRA